jgi:hypothetical protein
MLPYVTPAAPRIRALFLPLTARIDFDAQRVFQVPAFAGGDMRRAAKLAGVNPSTLYRLGGRSSGE